MSYQAVGKVLEQAGNMLAGDRERAFKMLKMFQQYAATLDEGMLGLHSDLEAVAESVEMNRRRIAAEQESLIVNFAEIVGIPLEELK